MDFKKIIGMYKINEYSIIILKDRLGELKREMLNMNEWIEASYNRNLMQRRNLESTIKDMENLKAKKEEK
jgi:hypothetical protein